MYTIITNNQLKANEKKQCWKITFVFLSITCLVLCFEKRSFTYLYYLAFPLSMLVSDYISLDDAMFSPDIPRKSIKDSLKSYNKALISRFVKKREGTLRVGQFILCILINITVSTLILVPKLFCIFKPVAIALKGCIYGSIISIIILGIIALKLRYSK